MRRQDTRYFGVDEEHKDAVLEAAEEYGVTAIYSGGNVMLRGAASDIKDVMFDKFELYDEDTFGSERNRTQPIRSILDASESLEAELESDSGTEDRYDALLEEAEPSSHEPAKAITDGGEDEEEIQTMGDVDHTSEVEGPQRSMW